MSAPSSQSWPPALKDWVSRCLSQMTETNRSEAQAELRKVIADAFNRQALWDINWDKVVLHSLTAPKSILQLPILKRKTSEPPVVETKKQKKAAKLAGPGALAQQNDRAALDRRAQRFAREHELERQKAGGSTKRSESRLYSNAKLTRESLVAMDVDGLEPSALDLEKSAIVGKSQEIYKDYLRLTSEPKPETIRPAHVLELTFTNLSQRWKSKEVNYHWMCSQLKSLRQDLTVQRIKTDLTVKTYQLHARIALEESDLVEFNACLSMLKSLHESGLGQEFLPEFTAYRILLLLHGRNRSELNIYVGQLTNEQKQDIHIKHALAVQKAMLLGNYYALFALYKDAPSMAGYLMDHFVPRERLRALIVMSKAYKSLPMSLMMDQLAFETTADLLVFLGQYKLLIIESLSGNDTEGPLVDLRTPGSVSLQQTYDETFKKVGIKGAV
ncbi:hypothetical protein CYLTODRAFT_370451 [Cylindrobasidium torrendii FP15055 ss-10]|uniref:PCI domain-containing protein n=1 Tax=Cylindrobasidium torrendii FP15055 ss-10 TaxID=1314674 RepID=A0A0D7BMF7_9AGAR|nr:hypothetical protein CYLTODRAFT_370451 [Cylindrobasidium torrendii FP15055 ss-10]